MYALVNWFGEMEWAKVIGYDSNSGLHNVSIIGSYGSFYVKLKNAHEVL